MTIAELIAILSEYPSDDTAVVYDARRKAFMPVEAVYSESPTKVGIAHRMVSVNNDFTRRESRGTANRTAEGYKMEVTETNIPASEWS